MRETGSDVTRSGPGGAHTGERGNPSLWSLVVAGVHTLPSRPVVRDRRTLHTFRTLHDTVFTRAAALARAGVRPDTTVVLLFENTADSVVDFLALARLGAVLVTAEPDSTPAALSTLVDRLGEAVLVGAEQRIHALRGAGERPAATLVGTPAGGGTTVQDPAERPEPGRAGSGPADFSDRLPAGRDGAEPALPSAPDAEAPFLHQFTSGSTGEPKAAVHSQGNLVRGARIYAQVHGYTADDRVLVAVPLLHSFGMVSGLVTALLTGACLHLTGRFAPGTLLRELAEVRATVLVATPLAYDMLARSAAGRRGSTGSVRLCLSSGAALADATAERFHAATGLRVQQVYGSTEAGIIATQRADDTARDRGVGHLAPGVDVALIGEDGERVPAGELGMLLVRTPAMFAGYHGQSDATAAVFDRGRYMTGDVARLDEAGRLHLIGRKDSFINVGGKKVNPVEVEAVVTGHPMVAEAAVWGEELPDGGQRVRATVVVLGTLSAAELTAYCRKKLLPHQVPDGTEFVTELPRTSSGKIRRAALKDGKHHGTHVIPAGGNAR